MKTKKLLNFCYPIFILISACSNAEIHWNHDGTVTKDNIQIETDLQNTYTGYVSSNGIFLGGYKIDKSGVNYPHAVFVSNDLSSNIAWERNTEVQHFFSYNNETHLLDNVGNVELFENQAWKETSINLQPNSIIVESSDFIVACKPTPLMKIDTKRGTCYSQENSWEININWRKIKPKMCGAYLIAVDSSGHKIIAHQINIKTGEINNSISMPKAINNICSLKFF